MKYMADNNQYKIELGVKVNTRDIQRQINDSVKNTQIKKIKLELNTKQINSQLNSIRKQIQNLSKIKVNLNINSKSNVSSNGTAGLKQVENDLKRIQDLAKQMSKLQLKIGKLDSKSSINQIKELEQQLSKLSRQYNQVANELNQKNVTSYGTGVAKEFVKAKNELAEFEAKLVDVRAELTKNIKIKLADGTFRREVNKIDEDARKLRISTNEITEGINDIHAALTKMETSDAVNDVDALMAAYDRLLALMKSVKNQIDINKIAQQKDVASQKLSDNRTLFQSEIDSWLTKNSAAAKKFGKDLLELKARSKSCDQVELDHLKNEFKQIDREAEAAGLKIQNFGDRLKTQFAKYSSYFSVASLFIYATQGLRDMFDQVVSIDTAMTELKKVTDETTESYDRFLTNASSRAKEIGTTVDGLVESTADFARLGYDFKDAQGLAEVANIYAVVGDDIDSVETATQSLISTLTAFKDEMGDMDNSEFALSIVDKMNEVANNYAISSGGIGEALQRSASSMMAANNSLDETIALITAANTVVQDPDSVGTAFKTISMRIRGAKTELEEAGLETEGMVESTAKLREEILALSGVDIMLNDNEFKSTYQIMEELADKWQDLSDIQQATVTELIAGKRQGNIVSSLMSNFDIAEDALQTSLDSSGSAMKEHEKWMQSLDARLNQVKATWQSLSQSFMSSDFLKGALDTVIALVNALDWLINNLGTIPTLLGAFATFKSVSGKGFFKTIEDEAALSGKKIVTIFNKAYKEANNIFKTIGLQKGSPFKDSIDNDIRYLNEYLDKTKNGASISATAFDDIFKDASESAKKFAQDGRLAAEGVDGFVQSQKAAQVSIVAQNKTLSNAKDIIREYYNGCKNAGMSQESFAKAVGRSNPELAKQLTTAKNARGAFKGYATQLIGVKVASLAVEAASMAMNAALTMGISFLVSAAINAISKWINAEEELAEKIGEVTSKYKEQHDELMELKNNYDTSNESSMVSRYEKLSKGVDGLGKNVSLTADEYAEYQEIVNTIAGQIPTLVSGYDEQGNAILSCKDNISQLIAEYEKLIHLQNQEILVSNSNEIEEDWKNTVEQATGYNFWEDVGNTLSADGLFGGTSDDFDMKTSTAKWLGGLTNKTSQEEIKNYLDNNGLAVREIKQALQNADFDISQLSSNEKVSEVLAEALDKEPEKIRGVLDNYYAGFDEAVAEYKTKSTALLSEAFDVSSAISGLNYDNISEELQNIAYQTVNSLDFDFLTGLTESGTSIEDWTKEMLNGLNALSSTDNRQIETAFELQTKFNDGEISYGEYVNGIQNVENLINGLDLKEEVKEQLKLSLNTDKVTEAYDALKNRLTKEEFGIKMETDKAEEFLDSLTASEHAVAVDLIVNGDVDLSEFDADSLKAYIEKQVKINEALNYTIAIDVETESIETLNTAMAESVSGAGLSSEAIAALKSRYADLGNEGYNLSAMFEETANGIHLNRKAVSELEQAYATDKLEETDSQLKVLKDRYDELAIEIDNCTDASERAALYTEQQSITDKINDLATLAAQYEGLASAYNAWLATEEAGSERDMYEGIIGGFETVGDEISRGWVDDGTIKFLELLTGKTDLAGKSGKELKKIYDDLDDTIKNTTYSVRDFFTVDEDGNSTNTGVYNFLDAVGQLEEEAFSGLDVVKRDKDGNIIGFDFELVAEKDENGNVIKNGDQVIAEALGISEELVQIMVRAADDAGFVVNLEGAYTQLADLKTEAESARNTLISLQKNGLEKLKGVDVNFNLDAEGNDLVAEQEKAVKLLDKFRKDGKINLEMEGAQEALDIAEYLTIKLDDLTEPKFMQIDTSEVDEELRDPIAKIQEIGTLCKQKHLVTLEGDTEEINEVQEKIDTVAEELAKLEEDEKIKVGIDPEWDSKTIADKIEKGEIEIPAELELDVQMSDDLKDIRLLMMDNLGLTSDGEVELKIKYNIDDSTVDELIKDEKQTVVLEYIVDNEKEFNKYTETEKEAVVKLVADGVDIEKYEAEDKEAIVNYIANGEEADGWTPEAKDAFVKYLVDGGEPDKFDPENKESWVVYKKDSKEPDSYKPTGKEQIVTSKLNSNEVDSYQPKPKTLTINAVFGSIKNAVSNAVSAGKNALKNRFGIGEVDGTANVDGTTGRAFKQGSWGTKNSGSALVGELGRETLVRNGRYYTIGNDGAELIKYQKGDIIFNHKQTEELFTNGKVTSGGGRARALVGGTAFIEGTAFSGGSGGTGKVVVEANNVDIISKNVTTKASGSNGSGGGIGKVDGKSVGSKSSSKSSSSSSADTEKFEETLDWIEVAIDRIERAIDRLDTKANSVYRSWSERNKNLTSEISKVEDEIALQQKAYERYLQEANSVGLSSSYAAKVRNGEINIEDITNEDLADKISQYTEWYEKALDCQDAILELQETESKLYAQRVENIATQYEGILGVIEHEKNILDEYIAQNEANAQLVSANYYNALISNEKKSLAQLQKQKNTMLSELEAVMQSGTIAKYSESW